MCTRPERLVRVGGQRTLGQTPKWSRGPAFPGPLCSVSGTSAPTAVQAQKQSHTPLCHCVRGGAGDTFCKHFRFYLPRILVPNISIGPQKAVAKGQPGGCWAKLGCVWMHPRQGGWQECSTFICACRGCSQASLAGSKCQAQECDAGRPGLQLWRGWSAKVGPDPGHQALTASKQAVTYTQSGQRLGCSIYYMCFGENK